MQNIPRTQFTYYTRPQFIQKLKKWDAIIYNDPCMFNLYRASGNSSSGTFYNISRGLYYAILFLNVKQINPKFKLVYVLQKRGR
jgi:hypothetical protein